ncbi:hypothetical protein [Conexibacter sp. DBS9H8]|uniref:hypothetical protein n=1 Tax=Conexibacter sp. DBS9H8 TaxID=2937801 RepID=UPI00200EAF56|nr:hypothetical protein [Conexibacter sp. DBS9H8]
MLLHRLARAPRFTVISVTRTNQDGFYEFPRAEGVVLTNRSWFVRGPRGSFSHTLHERVAATATLMESTSSTETGQRVTFTGTVTPGASNRRVLLQLQVGPNGRAWRTIAATRTNGSSAFTITRALARTGEDTLRVLVPGDAVNVAGTSDPVTLAVQQAQNPAFTIAASAPQITVGDPLTLSGSLSPVAGTTLPTAGTAVALYGRTAGGRLQEIATTTTQPNGSYRFTVTPLHNTAYVVETVASPAAHSASLSVGVADAVTMAASATTTTAGSAVHFSGNVSPDHAGHPIYLQMQTAQGGWQNIAVHSVNRGSRFGFVYRFGRDGTHVVRARIFGGSANVGAGSVPITITVAGTAPAASLPTAG